MKKLFEKIGVKWNSLKNEKISPLLVWVSVLSVVCLLISNIIAVKTFNLFKFPGQDWFVVLPCAIIVFPFTYILSDVISEVYGYKWSRRIAWMSFFLNLLMVAIFEIAIVMPGTTDLSVLHSTWFLLLASLLAYMVGKLVDDKVFKRMKIKHGDKHLVGRAILSSLCGEFCDSLIYIPLGMYLFPLWFMGFSFMQPMQLLVCVFLQPLMKVVYELAISPLTYIIAKKLKEAEFKAGNTYDI